MCGWEGFMCTCTEEGTGREMWCKGGFLQLVILELSHKGYVEMSQGRDCVGIRKNGDHISENQKSRNGMV